MSASELKTMGYNAVVNHSTLIWHDTEQEVERNKEWPKLIENNVFAVLADQRCTDWTRPQSCWHGTKQDSGRIQRQGRLCVIFVKIAGAN